MLKSVELKKGLEDVLNQIETLRAENKVDEVRAKLAEAKQLKADIEAAEAEENEAYENFNGVPINGNSKTIKEPKDMTEVKEMSGQLFKNAVMPNEKMADKFKNQEHKDVDLGKLAKGVITGDWSNAAAERNYLNVVEMSGDGKVLVPQHLSMNIFDAARAKSAVFGKVPTVTLQNGNLTIAKVAKDPTAHFVAEGEAIPFSDVVFAPVKLKSKVLAAIVPVSEILLKDGQNVEEALRMALAGAIAEAMDKALLYGTGDGTEEAKEPKGILTYADINKDTFADTVKYTDVVKGVKPIAKANLKATDAVMPTDNYYDLLSSTNAQGDFLNPPKALEGVALDGSNNVKADEAVVLDRNAVVVGVSPYLMIEKGYTTDQFAKLQKSLRVYIGVDVALVNNKGITHLTKAAVRSKK